MDPSDFAPRTLTRVAAIEITTEQATEKWRSTEVTWGDLGHWNTFAFRLADHTLTGLAREFENAPSPGYAPVASNKATGNALSVDAASSLTAFLAESELTEEPVPLKAPPGAGVAVPHGEPRSPARGYATLSARCGASRASTRTHCVLLCTYRYIVRPHVTYTERRVP